MRRVVNDVDDAGFKVIVRNNPSLSRGADSSFRLASAGTNGEVS